MLEFEDTVVSLGKLFSAIKPAFFINSNRNQHIKPTRKLIQVDGGKLISLIKTIYIMKNISITLSVGKFSKKMKFL